jgi:hypothetical protein
MHDRVKSPLAKVSVKAEDTGVMKMRAPSKHAGAPALPSRRQRKHLATVPSLAEDFILVIVVVAGRG